MTKFIAAAAISLSLVGCGGSTSTSHSSSNAPAACLTDAPGGKLCGSDAKTFCQNMKTGQTVDPASVGPTTKRECATLGVAGLR